MKSKIYLLLVLITTLFSCNDNVIKEKDKYPEIPNFPKFKNNVFESKRVAEISLKLDKKTKNQNNYYYFKYLIKDSTAYIITFFSDSDHPDYPYGSEDYTVDLLVIDGNQTIHSRWIDDDFDFSFDLDKEGNLSIGKRKYEAKTKYSEFKSIADSSVNKTDTLFKTWRQGASVDLNVNDLKAFDEVTIGSRGGFGGNNTMPLFSLEYDAVPLTYYELNYKGKKGLTKIDFRNETYPLVIRTSKNIFYVTYMVDYLGVENQTRTYTFNRID